MPNGKLGRRALARELELRTTDLENALRAIGRLLTDASMPPPRRIDQAMGVVKMFGCEPSIGVDVDARIDVVAARAAEEKP